MILSVNSGIKEGRGLKTYLGLEFFPSIRFSQNLDLLNTKSLLLIAIRPIEVHLLHGVLVARARDLKLRLQLLSKLYVSRCNYSLHQRQTSRLGSL